MEIRRAILLFAIVLGLAALVTSVSRTDSSEQEGTGGRDVPSRAEPRSAPTPAALRFAAGADPQVRTVRTGRAAGVEVDVLAPGQVAIEGLGLSGSALPGTPARFDVLLDEPGRHPITFTPANGAEGRTIGVLRVRE